MSESTSGNKESVAGGANMLKKDDVIALRCTAEAFVMAVATARRRNGT
jgi:hypothetical protein